MRLTIIIMITIFAGCINKSNKISMDNFDNSTNRETISKSDTAKIEKTSELISEDKFWSIIEYSISNSKNSTDQLIILKNELIKLSTREIIGFDLRKYQLLKDSYTSDLWCAAYIINGGCSDDCFEYFRCWIISKGKELYYGSISNPDYLVDKVKRGFFRNYELEPFLYVAYDAFKIKTGLLINDYEDMDEFFKNIGTYSKIEFNWQEDNPNSMKVICPLLYDKFN